MDFSPKTNCLKDIDKDDSTKRDKHKVTIKHPDVFRDNLGSLKDRLFNQFHTEKKSKNSQIKCKNKSRNLLTDTNTAAKTNYTEMSAIKMSGSLVKGNTISSKNSTDFGKTTSNNISRTLFKWS